MKEGHLSGAAIDVFDVEPYFGELRRLLVSTPHGFDVSLIAGRGWKLRQPKKPFDLYGKASGACSAIRGI